MTVDSVKNDPNIPDLDLETESGKEVKVIDPQKGTTGVAKDRPDGGVEIHLDLPKDSPKNDEGNPPDKAPGEGDGPKKNDNKDNKAENKKDDKADDKDTPKDAPKDTPKDAPKDTPKDDTPDTPKDTPKDAPKDTPKDDTSADGAAPKNDTTPEKKPFTSTYKPGEKINDELLDKLEEKGGKPTTIDGKRAVTMPDGGTFKLGDPLTKEGAADVTEAGIEKPEKDTGEHYHQGDLVTPEMAKDLKDHYGFTENEKGDLVSPDKKTVIPAGKPLDQADADALAKLGVHKSTAYDRADPNSDANRAAKAPPLTAADATKYKYEGPTDGDHPPKLDASGKNPVVYEYNEKTKEYEAAGEVAPGKDGKEKYFAYDERDKANIKGGSIPGEDVWDPKYYE